MPWTVHQMMGILTIRRVALPPGATEVLATPLLDSEAFPAALFADLYHRRWGIETDYRRLKQTLSLENVSGRTVCAVQQDIHACQLLGTSRLADRHPPRRRITRLPDRLCQPPVEWFLP